MHETDVDVLGCKLNNIHEENQKDVTVWFLIKHILEVWPQSQDKCPDSIKEFYSFCYELSVVDGLVLKGTSRLVIPNILRQNALNKLHISHLGTSKMILQARMCVFWLGINADIRELCEICEICKKFSVRQPSET